MIHVDLLDEIKEFCDLNELHLEDTLNKALRGGFTTLKFGATPISFKNEKKPVEVVKTVEVIKEVIKEVEVEKIVEVIKEVDKIIEVPVEKSVNINVDGHTVNYLDYIEELNNKNSELEVDNKKVETTLKGAKIKEIQLVEKVSELNSNLIDVKKELKECNKNKNKQRDIYGEFDD
jgi:hypothetical protein